MLSRLRVITGPGVGGGTVAILPSSDRMIGATAGGSARFAKTVADRESCRPLAKQLSWWQRSGTTRSS